MEESAIEPAAAQEHAQLALTFTALEMKLLRLMLDANAQPGEVAAASKIFIQSLRDRGVSSDAFEPLLEIITEIPAAAEPVETTHIADHFEIATAYVLNARIGPSAEHMLDPSFANLHAQFLRQAIIAGRI